MNETVSYKGYTIEIAPDEDAHGGPDEWGDDSLFLVNYHRDFQVKRDEIITEDEVRAWYNAEKIPQKKEYHIYSLTMLSHSGVWLKLGSDGFAMDAQGWDTSRVGMVLARKKEFKTKKKAVHAMQSLIESWNDVLSGNVWGYIVKETGDSCWGFYGDIEKNGVIESAREIIDADIADLQQKNAKRLRAYILNRVPLEKRELITR